MSFGQRFPTVIGRRPKAVLVAALLGSMFVARDVQGMSVGPFVFFFDSGSARITPQTEAIVANFAGFLQASPYITVVEVHGHADRAGPASLNRRLSCRRAAAVRRSLIAKGISPDLMVTVGWGEEEPLVSTGDGVAEAQNRRVEIIFFREEDGQSRSKPHGPACRAS